MTLLEPPSDEAEPPRTRRRIVLAADALFYAKGVRGVGMDEVREAAGVTLRRLYAEFPSKDSLVLAVLHHRHDLWTYGVQQAVGQVADPRGRLLAVYDFLADWFGDDTFRGCGFINAFGELGGTSPAVAAYAREHKRSFRAFVAGLVAEAGYPAELGPQLCLLAEGAQTTAAIEGTTEAADQARRAAEVLIDAAMARPAQKVEEACRESEKPWSAAFTQRTWVVTTRQDVPPGKAKRSP